MNNSKRIVEWLYEKVSHLVDLMGDNELITWIVGMLCALPLIVYMVLVTQYESVLDLLGVIVMSAAALAIIGWQLVIVFFIILGICCGILFFIIDPREAIHNIIEFLIDFSSIIIGLLIIVSLLLKFHSTCD
jgi:hypothetical protein